ncbi:MAG: hypothetical protein Q9202_007599, partial [Teloschistes flavicans]
SPEREPTSGKDGVIRGHPLPSQSTPAGANDLETSAKEDLIPTITSTNKPRSGFAILETFSNASAGVLVDIGEAREEYLELVSRIRFHESQLPSLLQGQDVENHKTQLAPLYDLRDRLVKFDLIDQLEPAGTLEAY